MDQEYIAQTALDQMVGTDQGQLLKALIPYFPPRQQQFLSVFAKARELSNTVALFTKPSEAMQIQAAAGPAQPLERIILENGGQRATLPQPLEVINDLRRYCFGDIRKTLDQITNMMTMAEMLRMMNEPSPEDNCEEERQ